MKPLWVIVLWASSMTSPACTTAHSDLTARAGSDAGRSTPLTKADAASAPSDASATLTTRSDAHFCTAAECRDADAATADVDAGVCTKAPLPQCSSNNWPYCADSWNTALSWYKGCHNPFSDAYLARCGKWDAIIVLTSVGERRFFYDSFGRLAGFANVFADSRSHCESYEAAFQLPDAPCVPRDGNCSDAGPALLPEGSLQDLDAGTLVSWDGGHPECNAGQAAYDTYLAEQLAQWNTCASDAFCNAGLGPAVVGPRNPCRQPCGLVLSTAAINSQIIARLDTFGFAACARCEAGPPPACSSLVLSSKCVAGRCEQSP